MIIILDSMNDIDDDNHLSVVVVIVNIYNDHGDMMIMIDNNINNGINYNTITGTSDCDNDEDYNCNDDDNFCLVCVCACVYACVCVCVCMWTLGHAHVQEENIDLEELEQFAKTFKRRRIELGGSCYLI